MKIRLTVTLLCCTLFAFSQTQLISPTGDGGFQNGPTFAANGWGVSNTTYGTNKWFMGIVPGGTNFPTPAAYISYSPTGALWAYEVSSSTLSHFYRNVTLPAGETDLTLSFHWQCGGESVNNDALMVSIAPASYIPTGSYYPVFIYGAGLDAPATTIAQYWNSGTTDPVTTLKIPPALLNNSFAAATITLIFTWKNNNNTGDGNSIAIDDISLTSQLPRIHGGGVYTIDNTLPEAGNNFQSFTNAINALHLGYLNSPLIFNVAAGQVFAENPPLLTATGTATNPITFQRSGAGANPVIRPGVGANFGFGISGGDYITIDGIDINSVAGAIVNSGYMLQNASATNGAQHNTIKNVSVSLDRTNANSRCIYQCLSVQPADNPTNPAGANSYNRYYNFSASNSAIGVELHGNEFFPDLETEVGTTSPAIFNMIGDPATPNDISIEGIYTFAEKDFKLFNNSISNVTPNNQSAFGILINWFLGSVSVYNNKIRGITAGRIGPSPDDAAGISVISSGTDGGHSIRIYNNFISDINNLTVSINTNVPRAKGVFIQHISNFDNQYYVDFNSIRLETNLEVTSAALQVNSNSTPVPCHYYIRNNLLADYTGAQVLPRRHLAFASQSTEIGAAGSIVSGNVMDVLNDVGQTGRIAVRYIGSTPTYYSTVSSFETNTAQATANIQGGSNFVSATDLHITAAYPALSGWASASPWVTNDIDNDTRGNAADIGADQITAAGPLPVSLLNFTGRREGGSNKLQWTTVSEQQNKGFDIEYATDGRNFKPVGFVNSLAAGGNSSGELHYHFEHAVSGSNKYYYRLRQLDLNGNSKYSNVLVLGGVSALTVKGILPNPVVSSAVLEIESAFKGEIELAVNDLAGRILIKSKVTVATGINKIPVNLNRLVSGSYMLHVSGAGVNEVVKFVKQ